MSQDELKLRVMRALESDPNMSQRDLAKHLGVSLGGVNYCVKALIDIGWIKAGNFARNNEKRVYAYLLTPKGIAEKAALTAKFLRRKMDEYDALKAEIAQLQAELASDERQVSNPDLPVSSELSEAEEETLYLLSVPGMGDSVIEGMQEDLEDCATELDW